MKEYISEFIDWLRDNWPVLFCIFVLEVLVRYF